ncbi:hypothetical protein BBO99_00009711, partial [Phytophthora kernoviae]
MKRLVIRGILQLNCCALFRAMRNNSNVISLDVSNNELSDIAGEPIGNMLSTDKKLRALDLGFNKLTILSLQPIGNALRVNSVLTSLMLNSNQVFQLPRDQVGNSGSVSGAAVASSNRLSIKDRFFQAEAKCDQLVDEMKEQALTIQAEKEREKPNDLQMMRGTMKTHARGRRFVR